LIGIYGYTDARASLGSSYKVDKGTYGGALGTRREGTVKWLACLCVVVSGCSVLSCTSGDSLLDSLRSL